MTVTRIIIPTGRTKTEVGFFVYGDRGIPIYAFWAYLQHSRHVYLHSRRYFFNRFDFFIFLDNSENSTAANMTGKQDIYKDGWDTRTYIDFRVYRSSEIFDIEKNLSCLGKKYIYIYIAMELFEIQICC